MAVWRGGEFGGEWLYVYERLSPFAVHLTLSQTLLIGYTPIQDKKFMYWKELYQMVISQEKEVNGKRMTKLK